VSPAINDTAAGTSAKHERRRCLAQDIAETPMDHRIIHEPPLTRVEVQARIAALDDKITSIRTQIATHDLQRQASRKPIDSNWFHRAKTALRHLQRERAELVEHMASLPRAKDALKDQLIAVLRERHDEASWAGIMDEAHRRFDREVP
jgi:hypothetical protein